MAFTVPNETDAFHADQAELDSNDVAILIAGLAGTTVLSGCAVTAQGVPDMTVAVAAGVVAIANVQVTVTSGNVNIGAADATNPRFDLIVVNNAGVKSATAGAAAANPVFPAIPANSVVLAAVYVPANDTTIEADHITDKRVTVVTFDGTAPSTQAFGDSPTVGTAAVAARRDHKHGMPATIPRIHKLCPSAAAGVAITASGAEQDFSYTGPNAEVVTAIMYACPTVGTAMQFTLKHSNGQFDYDTPLSYTTIDVTAVGTQKGQKITSAFDDATIPADSVIALFIDSVSGTYKDLVVFLVTTVTLP